MGEQHEPVASEGAGPGDAPDGAAADSTARHRPLASRIWRGVRHATRTSAGDMTIAATHFARDVATFSRLSEYRNSIPRGASSGLEVPIA